MEERLAQLEERVARLEGQAQAQPIYKKGEIVMNSCVSVAGEVIECGLKENRKTASDTGVRFDSETCITDELDR